MAFAAAPESYYELFPNPDGTMSAAPAPDELERLQARLNALEQERKHLLAVIEILQEISGSLHFADIVQSVALRLGETFGLDRCSIFLAERGGRRVRLVASYEDPGIRSQVLRPGRRAERHRPGGQGRRVRDFCRTVGLRQVHLAAGYRGAGRHVERRARPAVAEPSGCGGRRRSRRVGLAGTTEGRITVSAALHARKSTDQGRGA